jgi:class 3 adenylate cyclase/Tol biopolymer transport system component
VADEIPQRLSAVLAADISSYTRLMEIDEAGTVAAWRKARADVIDPTIAAHQGRIVKLTGDGFLAEFATVEHAVKAALAMQEAFASVFAEMRADRRVAFRMGINLGDVWVDTQDIYGAGVNVAARLESLADAGGICISGAVRDAIKHKVAVHYEDRGLQRVKNVAEPIHVWSIRSERMPSAEVVAPRMPPASPRSRPRWILWATAGAVALLVAAGAGFYAFAPVAPRVASLSEWVRLTDFPDAATDPAFSADGRMITFLRGATNFPRSGQVYVKLLPNGESTQITSSLEPKYRPVFSLDGTQVAFTALGQALAWDTWVVPVLGGSPTRFLRNAAGLVWMDSQNVLFAEVMDNAWHMGIVTATENRANERELYFPDHERAMAHYGYRSPDKRSVLIVEMDRTATFQRCRVLPFDASSTGYQVGPPGQCTAAAWSPDGRWMYFSVAVSGNRHLWRERFPGGEPEQITFGPTGEDGVAIAPDGQSLVTSVGQGSSVLWIHDSAGERALSAEGYASHPEYGKSGRRVYYLERRSALSGETELRAVDLATGNAERLLPGISVKDFDVSTDEREVAYTIESEGELQIWLASLDRRNAPRKVTTGDTVSFGAADELVYRELDKTKSYLARVKKDGTGRARVTDTPIIDKARVSSDGTWAVAVVGRSDEHAPSGQVAFPLDGGAARTICDAYCSLSWDASGGFLYVSIIFGTGPPRTLALPLAGRTLAEMFSTAVDTAALAAPDVRALEHPLVAPGPDPTTYVFLKADNQQNLFRIPLHAAAWPL